MEYKTSDGGTIIVPRKAEDHLLAHPNVLGVLPEAIGRIILPTDGSFMASEVEMGRIVGKSGCVKTPVIGFDEKAHFALRLERENPSRVVVGMECQDTTRVSVLAFPSRDDIRTYVLVTSFIGPMAPKEPWDRSICSVVEFRISLDFWCNNALIYDPKNMGHAFKSTWQEIIGVT